MSQFLSTFKGPLVFGFIELFNSVLLPPYLLGFVLSLIVLTFVTIFLRWGVYQHLIYLASRVRGLIYADNPTKKPRIVEEIELRCKESSPALEQINTGALIDQVYGKHLLKNEQIDYFCRFLPNLLLSLGLLGTFLGITMNLAELSQTINDFGVGSIDALVEQVQRPLQGMGVAFISSLTAVACSALLTVVNLLRNTSIAKYQLISALEDYIDNIYGPALNRRSPLDKAVDRLETIFSSFVNQFSVSVKEAVSSSLGESLDQITEGNRQSNHLATQVYNRLMESSSSMMSGATMFRESAQLFEKSQFANKLASSTDNLANTQRDLARSASVLNQSTQALQLAIASLQTTSQETIHLSEEIAGLSKNSGQVLNLTQNNQKALADVVGEMQQSAQIFHSVIKTLDTLQKRLATRTDRFVDVHTELYKLVESLKLFTEEMRGGMQTLGDRLIASLGDRNAVNPATDPVTTRISKLGNDLNAVQSQLTQVVKHLESEEQSEIAPTRQSPPPANNSNDPFNPQLVNWEEEENPQK
ncbi:hypothetical protein J0895_23055 [Phormidium pseudopriestleyi FRX01]|uniref:MotA/TolQ/ExbB proton channel domain-containing protein n=1 Tax=Phormidium pseudopriestleyi FRX01 TaxID=1759528 RepID=A0ABS3FYU3_9CYAN|nr:hypothetical protein [Phormidium pseudopriestleyi]MBO0351908.1 hypothetical protein [Phormidium pseudopriestleyi FRX01]